MRMREKVLLLLLISMFGAQEDSKTSCVVVVVVGNNLPRMLESTNNQLVAGHPFRQQVDHLFGM